MGVILATVFATAAEAQYYNNYPAANRAMSYGNATGSRPYYANPRPAYTPKQYTASTYKYNKPQQTVQNSIYDGRFTIGVDYQLGMASYGDDNFAIESPLAGGRDLVGSMRDFERQIYGLQLNIGWRIFKRLGIEAFYTHSLKNKKIKYTDSYSGYPEFAQGYYDVSYKAYGIDALGFYPVNDFIELLATIGVGKYDVEAKAKISVYEDDTHDALRSASKTFSESMLGYRIGGGVQFWISKRLALRVMGRWTQLGGDMVRYMTEVNAGVRYHF